MKHRNKMGMDKHKNRLKKSRSPEVPLFLTADLFLLAMWHKCRWLKATVLTLNEKFASASLGILFPHCFINTRLAQFKQLRCSNPDANSERQGMFGSNWNAATCRRCNVVKYSGLQWSLTTLPNTAVPVTCWGFPSCRLPKHTSFKQFSHYVINNHVTNFIFSFKTSKQVWIQKDCGSAILSLSTFPAFFMSNLNTVTTVGLYWFITESPSVIFIQKEVMYCWDPKDFLSNIIWTNYIKVTS